MASSDWKKFQKDIDGEEAAIKLYQQILDMPESAKYRDDFKNFLKGDYSPFKTGGVS